MSVSARPHERARTSRRVIVGMFVGLLFSGLGLAIGAPVSAHTAFVGSTPADGSVVAEPVSQIVIEFTGVSEESGDGFVVLDASGQAREPSAVTTDDGKVFRLDFDPALPAGAVGVKWSVRAGDAHPIEGSFSFTIGDAATVIAPATSTPPAPSIAAAGDMSQMSAEEMAAMGSNDMSQMSAEEMAAMDDFLEVDESGPGDTMARLGRLVSIGSIVLAVGALAFAATTLRGLMSEIDALITGVRVLGSAIVVGAVIEYVGLARITGDALVSTWSSSAGAAAVARVIAGLAIALGLVTTTSPVRVNRPARSLSSAVNSSPRTDVDSAFWGATDDQAAAQPAPAHQSSTDHHGFIDPGLALARSLANGSATVHHARQSAPPSRRTIAPRKPGTRTIETSRQRIIGHDQSAPSSEAATVRRWQPDASSWLAFVGIAVAVGSFWFDGHTVSQGFRPLHALANGVHVVAGSIWVGGVVTMAVVLWARHRRARPTDTLGLVVRFSAVAGFALGAVVIAGLVMAVSILDSVGELTSTQWGQTLLLKSAAAGVAMLIGAYNHFRLMPALERDPADRGLHESVRSTVTAEAILLVFVVVVTAWLVAAAS